MFDRQNKKKRRFFESNRTFKTPKKKYLSSVVLLREFSTLTLDATYCSLRTVGVFKRVFCTEWPEETWRRSKIGITRPRLYLTQRRLKPWKNVVSLKLSWTSYSRLGDFWVTLERAKPPLVPLHVQRACYEYDGPVGEAVRLHFTGNAVLDVVKYFADSLMAYGMPGVPKKARTTDDVCFGPATRNRTFGCESQ